MDNASIWLKRSKFRFSEIVSRVFAFLTEEYGFRLVVASPTFVRFESPRVFINVYHGRLSYELGLEIGLLTTDKSAEEKFGLREIIGLTDEQQARKLRMQSVVTTEALERAALLAGDLLNRYGGDALRGDERAFQRMREIQSAWSDEYLREAALTEMRDAVDKAWKARDFRRVIQLYGAHSEWLTPAERRKLNYARSQVSPNRGEGS